MADAASSFWEGRGMGNLCFLYLYMFYELSYSEYPFMDYNLIKSERGLEQLSEAALSHAMQAEYVVSISS